MKKIWIKTILILRDERGLGTIEIVIIAAVLVGMALLFRKQIFGVFQSIMEQVRESVAGEDPTLPPIS